MFSKIKSGLLGLALFASTTVTSITAMPEKAEATVAGYCRVTLADSQSVANIRFAPGTSSRVMLTVRNGVVFDYLYTVYPWNDSLPWVAVAVYYPNGLRIVGFIRSDLLYCS